MTKVSSERRYWAARWVAARRVAKATGLASDWRIVEQMHAAYRAARYADRAA